MKYLHVELLSAEEVAAAIDALTQAGVPAGSIEIYSNRPMETDPPLLPRRSRMSLGAVLAGLFSGTAATALMFWMQNDFPLVTGGMPINAGWATAVVTFECTMAGAVLGTFGMLLWEAGLAGRRGSAPVPDLPDEGVVLQVACSGETGRAEAELNQVAPGHVEIVST